jgi:hypothetical protein
VKTAAVTERADFRRITPPEWEVLLQRIFLRVSQEPRCKPILHDIGCINFQLQLEDRPELSDWEEYLGDRVVPHVGTAGESAVVAATTFTVFVGTLLRRISIMEAAADEVWMLRGDTSALMRCANLLPYVMNTFTDVVKEEYATWEGDPL